MPKVVCVQLPDSVARWLEYEAERHRMSVPGLVRELLLVGHRRVLEDKRGRKREAPGAQAHGGE
jgi:hypothetical protein